jgi:hypothetical protein
MADPEHEPPEQPEPDSGPNPFEVVPPPPTAELRPGSPALRAPAGQRRTWRDRWRSRHVPKAPRPETKEARPKRAARKRVAAVDDFTDVAMWAGDFFSQRTGYRATGHAIALNASTTGFMLDDAIKGTVVDRVAVQPAVRNRERFESVLVCFEIPVIVNMIERDLSPENIARWAPRLRRAVQRALPLMVPAIRKVRQREEDLKAAAQEIYGADIAGSDGDPIEAIMRELLSPLLETGPDGGARTDTPPPADAPAE